jgi:hypothetical protein
VRPRRRSWSGASAELERRVGGAGAAILIMFLYAQCLHACSKWLHHQVELRSSSGRAQVELRSSSGRAQVELRLSSERARTELGPSSDRALVEPRSSSGRAQVELGAGSERELGAGSERELGASSGRAQEEVELRSGGGLNKTSGTPRILHTCVPREARMP